MGLIDKVTDSLGLTNVEGQRQAAFDASILQRTGAAQAGAAISRGRREARTIQAPFLGLAQQGIQGSQDIAAQGAGISGPGNLLAGQELGAGVGTLGSIALGGNVLGQGAGQIDPQAVLNDPFFQALQEESTRNLERSAAGRGRVGAGDTRNAIARQSLLLGRDFGQQNLQNRLQANQQRFNQLQSTLGFGVGAQEQRFGQLAGSQAVEQQRFGNEAGLQSQLFNQQFGLLGAGQRAADVTSSQILGAQQGIANAATGAANAGAAGVIGGANVQNPLIGPLIQGATTGLTLASAGAFLSDRRFKENIKRVGQTDDGLNIYTYNYIGDSLVQMGVMAQEIELTIPEAVIENNGVKYVNYGVI